LLLIRPYFGGVWAAAILKAFLAIDRMTVELGGFAKEMHQSMVFYSQGATQGDAALKNPQLIKNN